MDIKKAMINAQSILEKSSTKFSKLDIEILMSKAIIKDRKYIILNQHKTISKKMFNYFNALIMDRAKGKPIAKIIKKKEFWKYEFKILDDVLIPRPDTEIIIEQALKISQHKSKLNLLDIGVGSGCIILSLLKEREDFSGTGIDISNKSIINTRINAELLGVKKRLRLINSDVDNFNLGKYDIVLSNPPYISKYEINSLEKDILKYEPRVALDGGLDGISEIRKVIDKTSKLIKKNGKFILEIAYNQKNKVIDLLKNKGFYINKTIKDYAKNDRCVISTKI
jgi:release factor glutamine methyltransferase